MSKEMRNRQRVYGIILILCCIVIVAMAAHGSTLEEQDIGYVPLLFPLGVHMITTKKKLLYDFNEPAEEEYNDGQYLSADQDDPAATWVEPSSLC